MNTPEEQPFTILRALHLVPKAIHTFLYTQNSWNVKTLVFRKAARFVSPTSTWTVRNLLDNADAGRPFTQDWPALLIDSATGHYNSSGMHSTSLWLYFLTSTQLGRALERNFVYSSQQLAWYTLPWLPDINQNSKMRIPLYSGYTAVVPIVQWSVF